MKHKIIFGGADKEIMSIPADNVEFIYTNEGPAIRLNISPNHAYIDDAIGVVVLGVNGQDRLPNNLRYLRHREGLKMVEVENKAKLPRTRLYRYELGECIPKPAGIKALAEVFDEPVSKLGFKNPEPTNEPEDSPLKALRLLKGYTQVELAELVGSSAPEISRYERGEKQPNNYLIIKLASALDVPVTELARLILDSENEN